MMSRFSFVCRSTAVFASLACAGLLTVAGCHSPQEPQSPEVGLTKAVMPPKAPDLGRGEPRWELNVLYNISIDQPLRDLCKGPAPFFQFNSNEADTSKNPTMQTLAECMMSGPLQGQSIRLIGHTDPRGSVAYNDKLGLERAQRIKHYLVTQGIAESRITVETAGKSAASSEPSDWPQDRRVEIELAR